MHYDLRLEAGGVFKSWAVTRGPSLDPKEKRLAVAVEDHPLEYGDFEGTIPEADYGGGTVMIWDRGFYAPESGEPVLRSLRDGELKFTLAGQKLRGSFVLIHLKQREDDHRDNWLLIKHRDKWATPGRDDVLSQDRSVASKRSLAVIAAGTGKAAAPFMVAPGPAAAGGRAPAIAKSQRVTAKSHPAIAARPSFGPLQAAQMPRLTHPERTLWPGEQPVTKRQLASYLSAVSPWLMPHIHGRPCSLLRAPDGIEGEQFFQRHLMPGLPAQLRTVRIDGEHQPYLEIDDAATLVALAQVSVCEFHPWNSAPLTPHVAGRLVFDLDPAPDVGFDAVVEAAKDIRKRLHALGLVAFCKTTGGKGLHVVVPLEPDATIDWDQAKLFAQTVAHEFAESTPGRYVATMSKRKRSGRIFIDYLRNQLTATAVAPLSPRARPGAPVSMPLTWAQVRPGLDPSRFSISTAPAMIARSAAWKDYAGSARSLRAAIGALTGEAQ